MAAQANCEKKEPQYTEWFFLFLRAQLENGFMRSHRIIIIIINFIYPLGCLLFNVSAFSPSPLFLMINKATSLVKAPTKAGDKGPNLFHNVFVLSWAQVCKFLEEEQRQPRWVVLMQQRRNIYNVNKAELSSCAATKSV